MIVEPAGIHETQHDTASVLPTAGVVQGSVWIELEIDAKVVADGRTSPSVMPVALPVGRRSLGARC